jgi:hypothetical protein
MPVECDHCGVETGDPRACGDCAAVLCPDHESPFTHDCPSIESVLDEDTFGETTARRESRSPLRPLTVWSTVVVVVVVSLAVVGAAAGVFTPPAVGGGSSADLPDDGVAPATPPTPAPETVRDRLLTELNERRADAGTARLDRSPERRATLDALAADLARVAYFENESARDRSRFSARHRLAAAGLGCENLTRGFVVLTAERTRRSVTAFVRDAAGMLRPELATAPGYRRADAHEVGVHVTGDGTVYLAYVAC